MPVFVEEASGDRDARVNPAHLNPLPRLSPPPPKPSDSEERYEVVVVGSGPAGIMTSVLLSRYGITSTLTVDEKPSQVHAGQADGLQPRTLEVLQTLDLAHEVLTQGCQMHEVGFWNPASEDTNSGIARTSFVPDVAVPARYPHEVTIHQGRIERILNDDLEKYGNRVQRGWKVTKWEFDYGDEEFPVVVHMVGGGGSSNRKVRSKYLVGADGAHSTIREGMGLKLVGDHTDHVWGVMDSVVKTDFPDIRKRCAIHSHVGSIMIIPRERVSGNKVLTRIYCQMEDEVATELNLSPEDKTADVRAEKEKAKERREKVSLERITAQTQRVLAPYKIQFGEVDWWAAYQIGQRATTCFSTADKSNHLRIHIAGDACHTHSPKAGQGMNVSMMDAYNLSWKLAHTINGLTPPHVNLLATYEHERLDIAQQLIAFDTKFSKMFSGKIDAQSGLTHEEFVEVFRTGSGFTSGCGIQYKPGLLTHPTPEPFIKNAATSPDTGPLVPGRRILNVTLKRFADANPRNFQDDIPSTGRYRLLALLPSSFNSPSSSNDTSTYFKALNTTLSHYPRGTIELLVIFPGPRGTLEWTSFPEFVKEEWEWNVFGDDDGSAFEAWGVDPEKGAVAVVRPDGYVGFVGKWGEGEEEEGVKGFWDGVLARV